MVEMLASGTVVFLLDQAAKRAAAEHTTARPIRCGPLFSIRHVTTKRSFYTRSAPRAGLVVLWLSAFASGVLLSRLGVFSAGLALVGLGAALGGAASNLSDILRDRYVRDYIDLGWWPVFNVADIAIVSGLPLAFLPV
jgi:signal peptidase II